MKQITALTVGTGMKCVPPTWEWIHPSNHPQRKYKLDKTERQQMCGWLTTTKKKGEILNLESPKFERIPDESPHL